MSTKLGTLTLDLVAKIGNFVEPMNQAEKKAKGTSQNIAESFNVSTLAVNALGAAFAGVTVGGLAAFTNQMIDTGNEIKKLSQLSNASTFDFQFYAKGAETAGISMESFADKMKDMQDRIGDFQQTGGGPLADFFTNIAPLVGVTIEQFQKLSGPEALQLFYNSLEKVGATQNDMKFYMESIISDSSLLIPLLENGGEGFKKWGQAASDAGAIMSNEMIEKLALAKENMQMLNLQVEGVQVSLINGLAPVIQTVANNLDVVAVAMGTVAVVMTAKATPAFVMGTIEATRYQLALARMSAQAAGTTTTLTVLGGVARGALGLLGGPVGLALTVAAVAGSYLLFRDNTAKSTVSLRENNETVEQAIQKYLALGDAQRYAQQAKERESLQELTKEYDDLKNRLVTATYSLSRHNDMTTEQSKIVNGLISEYKKTGDIDRFSKSINDLGFINQESKDKISNLSGAVSDASNKVKNQTKLVGQMIDRDKQLIKNNDDVTGSIDRRSAALLKLTQKERDVYNTIGQELQRENYINANVSRGFMSRDKAEYFADKRAEAGIPYSKLLSKEMYIQIEQGYKLQRQTEKREESEKKLTEQKRKQLELAEKTVKSQTIDSVVARGEGNYNSVNLGKKYDYKSSTRNLTNMSVAQVLAAQDRKEFNAAGKYQVIPATLRGAIDSGIISVSEKFNAEVQERIVQNYLLTAKKGRNSIEDFIKGKSSDIVSANLDLSKEFASVANPATGRSYHAGSGKNKASISTKEAQNALMASRSLYAIAIASGKSAEEAWRSAFNGSFTFVKDSDAQKSLEVVLDAQNKVEEIQKESQDRQKTVAQKYFTEEERMAFENTEARKEIEISFAGDDEAIVQYLLLQEKAYNKELAEYQETQKLKTIAEKKQLLEAKSNWMTAGEYAQEYYALVREEILNTPSYSPEMKDALLQQANYQQNTEQAGESDQAIADYRDVMGYEESPLIKQYEVLDKMRKLDLINEEKYQQDKLKLQALSTASYMEGMIGGFASLVDENSKTYAVLFAAQKAFAVAQAMLNIPAAYSKAYDAVVGTPYIGPYIAPAVGAAAAALQVAQAASIKGVGFADGGFTGHGGKYEYAGVVHKGEGVLTQEEIAALGGPSGFYALRQSIKNGFADGGLVMDAPKVLNPSQNPEVKKAMDQVQSNTGQHQVNLNPNFVIVDEREKLGDYLFGSDGKKAFVKFFKQNRRELGIA